MNLIPIRCFSCNSVNINYISKNDSMLCCQRMILSQPDLSTNPNNPNSNNLNTIVQGNNNNIILTNNSQFLNIIRRTLIDYTFSWGMLPECNDNYTKIQHQVSMIPIKYEIYNKIPYLYCDCKNYCIKCSGNYELNYMNSSNDLKLITGNYIKYDEIKNNLENLNRLSIQTLLPNTNIIIKGKCIISNNTHSVIFQNNISYLKSNVNNIDTDLIIKETGQKNIDCLYKEAIDFLILNLNYLLEIPFNNFEL